MFSTKASVSMMGGQSLSVKPRNPDTNHVNGISRIPSAHNLCETTRLIEKSTLKFNAFVMGTSVRYIHHVYVSILVSLHVYMRSTRFVGWVLFQ
jgi:hypothetical protein